MSVPVRVISPEAVAVARKLYEQTNVPIKAIALTVGINGRTLSRWVKDGQWIPRSHRLPRVVPQACPLPQEGAAPARPTARPAGDSEPAEIVSRSQLIARLVGRIEAEIAAVERLVARARSEGEGDGAAESERAARTLAVLVRSLRELAALEKNEPGEDDDAAQRDADAFRRELGATLERVLAGGAPG